MYIIMLFLNELSNNRDTCKISYHCIVFYLKFTLEIELVQILISLLEFFFFFNRHPILYQFFNEPSSKDTDNYPVSTY